MFDLNCESKYFFQFVVIKLNELFDYQIMTNEMGAISHFIEHITIT